MEPIYKSEFPFPGISSIEIYAKAMEGHNSFYPIKVEGGYFKLMIKEGSWIAVDLSTEICVFIGDIIERYNL